MLHEIVNLKEIYNLEGDPKLEVMIPSTSDSEFRKKYRVLQGIGIRYSKI